MQANATSAVPPGLAGHRRGFRIHPLFAAATLAVVVAATGVAGAAAWRHQADARQSDIAQWQHLAATAADAGALQRLQQAATAGETAGQAALGETLLAHADAATRAEGERWLRAAAGKGHHRAQFVLGKAAMLGTLAAGRTDLPLAWQWLDAAAKSGDLGAAYYLGLLYRGGYGRQPDPARAARWFQAAAEGGVAQAMFLLANAYRDGDGVARDTARAVSWYEAAGEREHPAALQALAMAYRNGELDLPPDEDQYRQHMAEAAHALKHPALNP
ncbi:tetratricopeptide repeat protein [Cupriavidus agavae]|uniref:Sel1 repeat-containing protein n=1 Tax=Cupriavidus agavae TaxID=1001822 RepID=A0A4Q7S908_9BURK|nr:tetratricopeptide repeat protein [Cupriavidus agavae]RZT42961.1 Sel1 repeat-containing protein [Cupriavidus agavae]